MTDHGEGSTRSLAVARDGRCEPGGTRRISAADLYDAWLIAETRASLALAARRSADRGAKRGAFAVYVDALAAEEAAAAQLTRWQEAAA